jgi:poly(beta-D-mannuronate) lyase
MINIQKKRILILCGLICWVLIPQSANAFWYDLKSPYPVLNDREALIAKNCLIATIPPAHLMFSSIYKQDDDSSSIADKNLEKSYKKQTKPIWDYENKISKWTHNNEADCALSWMHEWAERNAMLKLDVSAQGEAIRKWFLATISSHYIQIKTQYIIDKNRKQTIEKWLDKLAKQVMIDYPAKSDQISRNNNHKYWAAWSVMITGIALNNRSYYKYGIQNFKKAMKQVTEDGALPLELKRKSMAFHYHLFALLPLVMIAETAKENGYNLYKYNNNALLKLINFTLNDLDNNQRKTTELTAIDQNLDRAVNSGQLAWLVPYYNSKKDERALKWILKFSPMKQRRIGGNLSQIYSE